MKKVNRAFKGVWIPKEIYLDNRLSWSEKILIVEIDSLDRGDGCFAGNEYLSNFIGINTTSISTSISKLVRCGFCKRSFVNHKRYLYSNIKCYYENTETGVQENHKDNNTVNKTNNNTPSVKVSTIWSICIEAYNHFCKQRIGVGCKMDGAEGKAMKSIILYLTTQVKDPKYQDTIYRDDRDDQVYIAWKFILDNWDMLDDFLQKQIALRQINSNLINILNQLRNGKNRSKTSVEKLKSEIYKRNS